MMRDAFMFTSKLLVYYYENYQWVRWNFKISHYQKNRTTTRCNESVPPYYLDPILRNKFVFVPPFKLEEQLLTIAQNNLSKCNSSLLINWEATPDGETKFIIPGGLFQPIFSPRYKRSSLHYMGIGELVFQWEEWAFGLPQWYVITIRHGPVRKLKKNIHYILDDTHF